MKANEAPEKLYFGEFDKSGLIAYSTKESNDEIEYTRTDAFIEKACEWLKDNIYHRVYECGDRLGFPTANFINEFMNYMKGE